jgi:hypothetical protein
MAIIGNGDIAQVLTDREGFCFFASGVSNSKERNESEYEREIKLLLKQDKSKHLVYFSSLRVFSEEDRYTQHKRQVENIVKVNFPKYTIVRIGNIDWGSNPNTIINYLRTKAEKGEALEIQDTFRYVVSQEEFLYWIDLIPYYSCEMNIPGERLTIKEIVNRYVYPRKNSKKI